MSDNTLKKLKEIKKWRQDEYKELRGLLTIIEEKLLEARDGKESDQSSQINKVPIYLTKIRTKSADSIYLKIKQGEKLHEIEDISGVRILCLFEQDLLEVYQYLINDFFSNGKYQVKKIKCFNLDKDLITTFKNIYQKATKKTHCDSMFDIRKKTTEYKSIHFIAKSDKFVFEIQLRTLLQDVWGELEHRLNYKRSGEDQFIHSSFAFLSRELSACEGLIKDLKSQRDSLDRAHDLSAQVSGPQYILHYEDEHLPQRLFANNQTFNQCLSYLEMLNKCESRASFVDTYKFFTRFRGEMKKVDSEPHDVSYWLDMEEAYLLFALSNLEEAKEIYLRVITNDAYKHKYAPYFRLGEIFLNQNDQIAALEMFDEAEEKLMNCKGAPASNRYSVRSQLAYTYWNMGAKYFQHAVSNINIAYKYFQQIPDDHDSKTIMQLHIYNNLCYYSIEYAFVLHKKRLKQDPPPGKKLKEELIAEFDKTIKIADEFFNKINISVNDYDAGRQTYKTEVSSIINGLRDTMGYYCFIKYKILNNMTLLEYAYKYAMSLLENKSQYDLSPVGVSGANLQAKHINEIYTEYKKMKNNKPHVEE